jgi:hypothetical protein
VDGVAIEQQFLGEGRFTGVGWEIMANVRRTLICFFSVSGLMIVASSLI